MRIIYFDIDSLRADHLGCYGYSRPTSPNIDRLADHGMVFTNCYVSDAPCLPSRTALFSGRYGIKNGVASHGGAAARFRYPGEGHGTEFDKLPLPMAFSRAGHTTATFSTFAQRHLAWHFYAGWDEIHKHSNKNGLETADEVNAAVEPWIRVHGGADDYLLHVNYWDPHTPYETPAGFGDPFGGDDVPQWPTDADLASMWERWGPRTGRDLPSGFLNLARTPGEIRTRADFVRWIDAYDTGIRFADHHIGRVLDLLDEIAVLDETVVVVSADHGEAQGELDTFGDHAFADHTTCRVPLIVRAPAGVRGESDGLVCQLDLGPTLCDLAGIETPGAWDGLSFAGALFGNHFAGRDHVVTGQGAWTCQRGVRTGPHIMLHTYHPGLSEVGDPLLFDVESDPYETTNLAQERPDVVAAAEEVLDEWIAANLGGPDPMQVALDEGGPWYPRLEAPRLYRRLRETGRNGAAVEIARRYRVE